MKDLRAPAKAKEEAPGNTSTDNQEKETPTHKRLSEIYADCFTLVLRLRAAKGLSDAKKLRDRVKQRLDIADQKAREAGFEDGYVRKAAFALVAFVDETVHSSDWDERAEWQNKPLQLERFDRYDAGEEFFVHLEQLRSGSPTPQKQQVLEVYYLCLTLGFEGRYQLRGQNEVQMLIDNVSEQLRRSTGRNSEEPLAPNARPANQTTAEMRKKIPTWAVVLGGAALAIIMYFAMSMYVSNKTALTVQMIENVHNAKSQPN